MAEPEKTNWHERKERIWRVIFLSDTRAGQFFDVVLLWLIAASVIVVMLESVSSFVESFGRTFFVLEWIFTALFTVEYFVRIWVVRTKRKYIFSFYGLVDLIAILPAYLSLVFAGTQFLMVTRTLRLLRMFRILKMPRHLDEADVLLKALAASRAKIFVFLSSVAVLITIEATLMYLIEGGVEGSGFTSIPQSMYWAVVTFTTVGYGDIAPVTVPGKMLASVIMLTGYGIIAVPTGIVTAEIYQEVAKGRKRRRSCSRCGEDRHPAEARYCLTCGERLDPMVEGPREGGVDVERRNGDR